MSNLAVIACSLFFFVYAVIGIARKQLNIQYKIINKFDTPLTFWTAIGTLFLLGVTLPCLINQVPYSLLLLLLVSIMWMSGIIFYMMKL